MMPEEGGALPTAVFCPMREGGEGAPARCKLRPESLNGVNQILLILGPHGWRGRLWSPGLSSPHPCQPAQAPPGSVHGPRGDKPTTAACPCPAPQAPGDIPPGELAGRPDGRESTWQKTSLSPFFPLHVWHLTKTAVWLPRGASTYALMKTFHLIFQAF